MTSTRLSLGRMAEWCIERSEWACRQAPFAYLRGQLISSRVYNQLKASQAPDPSDFARLCEALTPVFDSRDKALKKAAWLTLHCALTDLIALGPSDSLFPQAQALLSAWPSNAPSPDGIEQAHKTDLGSFQNGFFCQNSFFCRALYHGHLLCAQQMSDQAMPWSLPNEQGFLSGQLPSVILAQAQQELSGGRSGNKAAQARALLLCAFAQGANAQTLVTQGPRLTASQQATSGLTKQDPVSLGDLSEGLGCSILFESVLNESVALREQTELSKILTTAPQAKRSPSL